MLDRPAVTLSLSRALLGEVTASLRAVQFELSERRLDIFCIFNGDISDDDRESMSCVETEVMADFPDASVQVHYLRIDRPAPVLMTQDRYAVFARKK
jgi:hypothetical protein